MSDLVEPNFKLSRDLTPAAYRRACDKVNKRSLGWCEGNVEGVCPPRKHEGDHHHHVLSRAQGGEHTPQNLLFLCFAAHTWAHANPAKAVELGLIRRRSA